ncbi:sensor histidine kinase [Anaerostipes sp. CAG:276]|uniref:sensor histidine kinase n=1 Tax=Anaerostipes sp. CAG:276 TaxID=1262699 RepID=UPI00033CCEC4|nr:ATP-binding protein [Anaerostipes sp. CAG:276]CDC34321.1 hsp90-like protein [Anaerostipes sp. CAG:276]
MKRKIFLNMSYIALITVVCTTVFLSVVAYGRYMSQVKEGIQNEAGYMAESLNQHENQSLDAYKDITISRITLIAADGKVLYDSTGKEKSMSNHRNRKEFKEAEKNGAGESTRISKTLKKQTYYYAVKLSDGSVLRLSRETQTIFNQVEGVLPVLILMMAVVFVLALALSRLLTGRIIEPINRINLEHPEDENTYDELSPLLVRIHRQNEAIKEKIREIKEKQIEFTTITENMSEGFLILNDKSVVLSYNTSALRILDIREDQCSNQNVLSINRSHEFRRAVEAALNGEAFEEVMEFRERKYLLMANPVTVSGAVKGAVLMMIDVTEKEEREELRKEFSANVSHELKTPLTTISGYAELMKDGLVKQEDVGRFSEKIYTEARRLISMIEGIIKLSRLDENQIIQEKEEVDLYQLALEIKNSLSMKAAEEGIDTQVLGSPCKVSGVRQILYEMLYNLMENAVKYNDRGGHVFVTAAVMEGRAAVIVEDDGIGIPPEDADRIFERFYRGDKSHSSEREGTGLGLSIVKHGAKYHGAKIEVESEVGRGTKIAVIF